MSNSGTALTAREMRSQVRKAAVASTIGTTIEWYDYFLYGAAAALVFPRQHRARPIARTCSSSGARQTDSRSARVASISARTLPSRARLIARR